MPHIPFKFSKLSYLLLIMVSFACETSTRKLSDDYLKEDSVFRERLARGRDHYLKLVGLHPLQPSTNSFGAADTNRIQLTTSEVPAHIGTIIWSADSMIFTAHESVEVRTLAEDSIIRRYNYEFESSINSPMLRHQHLEWMVIKRAEEYFIREKNQNSALAKTFKGFERYPLQASYVVEANYAPFTQSATESVDTQLGTAQSMSFLGTLSFSLGGEKLQLTVGEGGFLIVGDATNGEQTYGGGRYVYVDLPAGPGTVTVDFNRLYNPPCVYSEFTTCPLPPSQNILPLAIEAGEKYQRL